MTPEKLVDVIDVRVALEMMAALKLSRDPHGPAMKAVREALRIHLGALGALGAGDELRSGITHLELHRTIWEQSGSVKLRKIWALIGSQIRWR